MKHNDAYHVTSLLEIPESAFGYDGYQRLELESKQSPKNVKDNTSCLTMCQHVQFVAACFHSFCRLFIRACCDLKKVGATSTYIDSRTHASISARLARIHVASPQRAAWQLGT